MLQNVKLQFFCTKLLFFIFFLYLCPDYASPKVDGAGQKHRWKETVKPFVGLVSKGVYETLLSVFFKLRNFESVSQR
jgi:hypothetical protein